MAKTRHPDSSGIFGAWFAQRIEPDPAPPDAPPECHRWNANSRCVRLADRYKISLITLNALVERDISNAIICS